MLLPASLSRKRLNAGRHWLAAPAESSVSASPASAPGAYGRIVGTPCVAGDNDVIGDCFPTACCNAVQTHVARNGVMVPIADSVAVAAYSGMTGYTAMNPVTDRGTDPAHGFAWWQANPIAGFVLGAVTPIAAAAEDRIRGAIGAGGVLLCVELSIENQNQRVWEPAGQPGSWGGHAIFCDEYDGDTYRVTSWGEDFYLNRSYFGTPGFVAGVYALSLVKT